MPNTNEAKLAEKREDVIAWERRCLQAALRAEAGRYGYTDVQDEEDGLSQADIDDEAGAQANEYNQLRAQMGLPREIICISDGEVYAYTVS